MKLKNVSDKTTHTVNLAFPIKRKSGKNMSIVLRPGECTYVEDTQINLKIRVFERKNMLEVTNEEKPNSIDFYRVYSDNFVQPVRQTPKVVEMPKTVKKVETESKTDSRIEKSQKKEEIDSKKTESEKQKRKPGRPFGTIRKPKTEKPKKPRGRPFGTTKKSNKLDDAKSNAEKYIDKK